MLNFTSSWDFVIFREYWISRSRCSIWCSVRAQGSHEKTFGKKNMFLHNFQTFFMNIYATKQLLFCWAKVRSPTVSNRFPLDTLRTFRKKLRCPEILILKNCGLDKFWPDHVSDRFRPFPFFWTINWTNSVYGRLIQCKPMQTMTLKFFRATLVRVDCTKYCILTLISNIP